MDVIGVYSAGVKQVVASCGTALSNEQVRSIKRHSDSIVVNFDPDTAGANATEKSIQILLDEGMHVRVLELAGGLDPDEFVKANGAECLQRAPQSCDRDISYGWPTGPGATSICRRPKVGSTGSKPCCSRPSGRSRTGWSGTAVAGEVAEYLGVDRALVLKEFRGTPGAEAAGRRRNHNSQSASMTDRRAAAYVADRSRMPRCPDRCAWEVGSGAPILLVACFAGHSGGCRGRRSNHIGQYRTPTYEPSHKSLLSSALFADTSEEVFSREQAMLYVAVLEADDIKLRVESLRTEIKGSRALRERGGSSPPQ